MKKLLRLACILFLAICLGQPAFGKPGTKPGPKGYPDYLTQKSWKSIKASEGVLVAVVPTFSSGLDIGFVQALVIDAKNGLLLSVAHGISDFPDVAFGKHTVYSFIFDGFAYPAELKVLSKVSDLAIFKIKEGDLSKLRPVRFAEKAIQFEEYYSFSQRMNYDPTGFEISDNVPWKATLVDINKTTATVRVNIIMSVEITVEHLIFDKAIMPGFSGAGLFNKKGELAGILTSYFPGFSKAVSITSIKEFVESYQSAEKEKEKKPEPNPSPAPSPSPSPPSDDKTKKN